jgi:hypothetical protein
VRENHAYDIGDKFMVLRCPPEPGKGFSTQVISFLTWAENGSRQHETVLPKDANVESICFEDAKCHLEIRNVTSGRLFALSSQPRNFHSLVVGWLVEQLDNDELWAALEAAAAEHGPD